VLKGLRFVHPMDWWRGMDWGIPGIYLLTGGRQIGKSTSTKLLIKELLQKTVFLPQQIFYLPCDQIDTYHQLIETVRPFIEENPTRFLLIVDEVTFVKDWDRAIKALADEGHFRRGSVILTGSDSVILKDAMNRFPGRRGQAAQTDFHLYPLKFCDYVQLTDPQLIKKLDDQKLLQSFDEYLQCGGYLKAINDFHTHGAVSDATYRTFEQWIVGDFEKRGKSLRYLKELLKALLESASSQLTYSGLTQRIGEMSKETLIDYCQLLERMDVLFSLQAFDQNKRIGFPKKARKFHFWDPFIFDTLLRCLQKDGAFFLGRDFLPMKVESVVAASFKSGSPTFYWKAKGEIDVVSVQPDGVHFIEVKWSDRVRTQDLQELKKQKNSVVLTRNLSEGVVGSIPLQYLPRYLLEIV
jgi:uncharacterized protein